MQRYPVGTFFDVDDLIAQDFQPCRAGVVQTVVEELRQVCPVEPTWNESGLRGYDTIQIGRRSTPQPVQKVPWPIREGPHVPSRHVQQMAGIGGPVGRARPDLVRALDQPNARIGRRK